MQASVQGIPSRSCHIHIEGFSNEHFSYGIAGKKAAAGSKGNCSRWLAVVFLLPGYYGNIVSSPVFKGGKSIVAGCAAWSHPFKLRGRMLKCGMHSLKNEGCKLPQRSSPGLPFVGSSGRLVVLVLNALFLQQLVQSIDAVVKALPFRGANAQVQ